MELQQFKSFAKGNDKKIEENKNVWTYTRVSSKEQQQNESLNTQIDGANAYAIERSFIVTSTFGGTYESASGDMTRKEFKRLIDEVRSAKKKPYAILINTISRFSRTGVSGMTLAEELVEDLGVHLIEVSTGKTTETEDGNHQIMEGLLNARKENIERLRVTLPGLKKFIKKGNWLGRAPRGYDHYGTKVKNLKLHDSIQKIIINDEGRILIKAWELKLSGERDYIILERLKDLGIKNVSKQFLSSMWRNPFYCGICAHKMLDGEVVRGNWEKMISEQDFLLVQEILKDNHFGYKQDKSNINRPLNGFIFCNDCGNKMTGYEVKKKGLHYYKCQNCEGGSINANSSSRSIAEGAHNLFKILLEKYELADGLAEAFKTQLKLTYSTLNEESTQVNQALKKELEKAENELKALKRRNLLGEVEDKELYNEVKAEFESKIAEIIKKLPKGEIEISNLDKYIEMSVEVASNISKNWELEGIETKRRIQELVFQGGLLLDVKNRVYLTKKVNLIFELSKELSSVSERKKKNGTRNNLMPSSLVAGARLERTTFGL